MTEPRTHRVYSAVNPFWRRQAERLRSRGGQYRPTTPADEATVRREQVLVDMARETAELHDQPIPPSPF